MADGGAAILWSPGKTKAVELEGGTTGREGEAHPVWKQPPPGTEALRAWPGARYQAVSRTFLLPQPPQGSGGPGGRGAVWGTGQGQPLVLQGPVGQGPLWVQGGLSRGCRGSGPRNGGRTPSWASTVEPALCTPLPLPAVHRHGISLVLQGRGSSHVATASERKPELKHSADGGTEARAGGNRVRAHS